MTGEPNPYRDATDSVASNGSDTFEERPAPPALDTERDTPGDAPGDRPESQGNRGESTPSTGDDAAVSGGGGAGDGGGRGAPRMDRGRDRADGRDRGERPAGRGGFPQNNNNSNNGRRSRRNRGRGGPRREAAPQAPAVALVVETEVTGWFQATRDGGYIRRAASSYLPEPGDAFVPTHVVKQLGLRPGDEVHAGVGRDTRGRVSIVEARTINQSELAVALRRPDFASLTAAYPDRKLTLETGRPAKVGPEVTRRAIDLIAPVGYGQRALIVAPARAGKTMLLQAITEGVVINHPNATLLILLVDERPEEVSEAISWGVGEVIASSFDQPAARHVDVTEMVLERARRLVELGRDVVIVLDSLTRMARAHNTAERGTGRTLSGGLDATAMAKPKAFFGSARAVAPNAGGGSLTIIATALVETGSRMDDVIFEEFKGTGNCEIKLDRSLAEKRIFPAFDIATSGTRREEKLYKPEQLDAVYTLRRGLQQMPPQSAMEWLIKRIAATQSNDALLAGL